MPLRMRIWIITLCALLASCQPGLHPPANYNYPADLERAVHQIERKEFTAATSLLTTLTQFSPEQPDPWRLLGGLYDLDGQTAQAHAVFSSGLAAAPPSSKGYADLALQGALLCVHDSELACDPQQVLQHLPGDDLRRELVSATIEAEAGRDVEALRQIIALLKKPLPKAMIADVYFLAAQIYTRMKEPMYANESLFHAVNFAQSPVMTQRIEKLWGPAP